ncbi:hypothetical protein LCGC14_1154220 [marine sediment metagenome]|uniref:AAA+ ATPase domain-containing protein n=1 Tax=marine sediment metagenome TaxID=412755 RepID=A0A0F9MHR9_9ZZZZ
MGFINQKRILSEVNPLIESLKNGGSENIILQGPAGCGKTMLAKIIARSIEEYSFQIPVKGNIKIDSGTRVQIIDEIHELRSFEPLYPLLDSEEHVFIFCTTEYGGVPEPFSSRCIRFTFDRYSNDDLTRIVFNYAKSRSYPVDIYSALLIAQVSRGSPRIAKQRFNRVKRMIAYYDFKWSEENIFQILNMIGIYNLGYTKEDMDYLEILKDKEVLGLRNISRILRVDQNTIVREIEPFLIEKGHIEITSKGRRLINCPQILPTTQ